MTQGNEWNGDLREAVTDWERILNSNPELRGFRDWLKANGLSDKQATIATCAALTAIFSESARAERQSPTRPYIPE